MMVFCTKDVLGEKAGSDVILFLLSSMPTTLGSAFYESSFNLSLSVQWQKWSPDPVPAKEKVPQNIPYPILRHWKLSKSV